MSVAKGIEGFWESRSVLCFICSGPFNANVKHIFQVQIYFFSGSIVLTVRSYATVSCLNRNGAMFQLQCGKYKCGLVLFCIIINEHRSSKDRN